MNELILCFVLGEIGATFYIGAAEKSVIIKSSLESSDLSLAWLICDTMDKRLCVSWITVYFGLSDTMD
jgi:hypothetical protein